MFNNNGLSMDQAPPIKVVFRFFLTGSIFGVIAGFFLLFGDSNLLNDYTNPATLALVHTIAIGIMGSFMLGALFQMLPVVCGVAIIAPIDISMRINYALIFGLIALISSFYSGSLGLIVIASLLLGFSFFSTAYIMINRLRTISHSNSSRGMLLALISLVLVVILGIVLLAIRGGLNVELDYLTLKSLHFSFALFGWIALLIISVSFQVIEMFYVTPSYPKNYAKSLPIVIFALLVLNIVIFNETNIVSVDILVTFLIAGHAVLTLIRLKQKKRAVIDATILFWAFAMILSIAFALLMLANKFIDIPILTLATLFSFFVMSIVYAMVYKIVPFLVWFHLNANGYFEAPMMHEVVHPKYARVNLYLFAVSFLLLIIAPFTEIFLQIGALFFIVSYFMLFLAIYRALHKYYYILENGKKFEFNFKT